MAGDEANREAMQGYVQARQESGKPITLAMKLAMLPTPAARDYKGANSPDHLAKPNGHHNQLPNYIAMLPTPRRCMPSDESPTSWEARNLKHKGIPTSLAVEIQRGNSLGLKLQPAFAEWMMGYPEGWTDPNAPSPIATPASNP